MIKEKARVIALDSNKLVLQTDRGGSCNSCAGRQNCGSATVTKSTGKHRSEIRRPNNLEIKVGDILTLGIEEKTLIQGAILLYVAPLIMMITGCVIGDYYANVLAINNELLSILFGVAGLASTVILTRYSARLHYFQQRFEPVILANDSDLVGTPEHVKLFASLHDR